jgi:hypothetical protein
MNKINVLCQNCESFNLYHSGMSPACVEDEFTCADCGTKTFADVRDFLKKGMIIWTR